MGGSGSRVAVVVKLGRGRGLGLVVGAEAVGLLAEGARSAGASHKCPC
jgi:hypothetical protein